MTLRLLVAACAFMTACSSTPSGSSQPTFTFSEPTEADAIPVETDLTTKDEVRKNHGDPMRVKTLDSGDTACTERWFYMGKVDVGLGPMDLLTYIDFDGKGNVCGGP